jgi:hypothetical protein
MSNLIQIKRSETTATPTLLANGELAWSGNSNVLFIGDFGDGVVPIAGARNPGVLTANQALVANATSGIDKVIVANAVVTTLTANGSTGTDGQILVSNGSVSYWANPPASSFTIEGDTGSDVVSTGETLTFASANGLTTVASNNQILFSVDTGSTLTVNSTGIHVNSADLSIATSQLTGDVALGANTSGNYVAEITAGAGISGSSTVEGGTPTIAVVANSGISANSSGVFAVAANGVSVDGSGINVVGGDGLVSNTTGVHIGQGNGITVDADLIRVTQANGIVVNSGGVGVDGGSTLTVNSSGVHVNSSLSITDLTLTGNLTVTGTLTTLDTQNLVVQDPLIKLANGNIAGDALDIGFYGVYDTSGTQDLYAGLYRDATDGVFRLFRDTEIEPTTIVDPAGAGYTVATLQAFLISGGLVSNSSTVSLTANSTVNVNITANTLTLSTALAGTSGGTGLASYTAEEILVANSSNGFRKLALGTDGQVLQSNGSALVYSTLDGGTF